MQLVSEFEALDKKGSDLYIEAKKSKKNVVMVNRGGKAVEVEENDMWEEVRHLGKQAPSWGFLSEKYPDVFNVSKEREQKLLEMMKFTKLNLGIADPINMTFGSIVKLIDKITDYKIAKLKK